MKVSQISISNFKSIREINLTLNKINVLIGPNGAGKSNFIQFFNLLNNIVSQNLQNYVAANGGADSFLYFGRKYSESFSGIISFGRNDYHFELTATADNNLFFSKEIAYFHHQSYKYPYSKNLASGDKETKLLEEYKKEGQSGVVHYILNSMSRWRVYHFHDTSSSAKVKQDGDIHDNRILRRDASNLPAFLYLLQEKYNEHFVRIENTVKLIAPFFEKFQLEPLALNKEKIKLEWKQVGSDEYFNANHLSDGSLRMICLITLLLQPALPDTIIIDEPELGLHPAAIELLTSLIKSIAANDKQIICSTQSVTFLNHFEPEDIIIVDRSNGESLFKRLDKNNLTEWLNEYAIGELWEKNVLGGRS
ncbi:MAG: AAA family ATPase [Ignavibacteriales bacterium]|nr:AAA family ATPase [Ignavibacteriales bacterium]